MVSGTRRVCTLKMSPELRAQSKLTTPRRENRKIRHENEILKVNEPTHVQIYQIIPKTYHEIS
jgi:hypothetical protein